jgi:hypothetical protein
MAASLGVNPARDLSQKRSSTGHGQLTASKRRRHTRPWIRKWEIQLLESVSRHQSAVSAGSARRCLNAAAADVTDGRAHAPFALSRRAAHLKPESPCFTQLADVLEIARANVLEACAAPSQRVQ